MLSIHNHLNPFEPLFIKHSSPETWSVVMLVGVMDVMWWEGSQSVNFVHILVCPVVIVWKTTFNHYSSVSLATIQLLISYNYAYRVEENLAPLSGLEENFPTCATWSLSTGVCA